MLHSTIVKVAKFHNHSALMFSTVLYQAPPAPLIITLAIHKWIYKK